MNYVDILFIVLISFSVFLGWKRGFLISFSEVLSWISCLIIGLLIYPYISSILAKVITQTSFWTTTIAFLISIIVAGAIISALFNSILRMIPESVHKRPFNKIFGLIPGVLNGVIYTALLAILFSGVPLGNSFSDKAQKSSIVYNFTSQTKWIETKLKSGFFDALNRPGNMVTIHPETNKLIKLPFKVKSSLIRPDLEKNMLELINQERSKNNLKPLKPDPALREVARKHSRDMFKRKYFSHYTIEGKDPFDRIKKAKIIFLTAGENLALSPNLTLAHTGLMESPGHKANILHPAFGRVGIGILDGGSHGIMITQNFRN